MNISRTIRIDDSTELTITTRLSSTELYNAYLEKEYEFDREDVVCEIEERFEEDDEKDICGMKRSEITEEMIDEMAVEKRRIMDRYNTDWDIAVSQAIEKVINCAMEAKEKQAA